MQLTEEYNLDMEIGCTWKYLNAAETRSATVPPVRTSSWPIVCVCVCVVVIRNVGPAVPEFAEIT